jgi:hypothetical protein
VLGALSRLTAEGRLPRDGLRIVLRHAPAVVDAPSNACAGPGLDRLGYHGTDWVPHDAKMREAGAPGARTRIETLFTLGRKPVLVPDQSLMDGINAGRKTIPFARFDKKRTAQGCEALRASPRAKKQRCCHYCGIHKKAEYSEEALAALRDRVANARQAIERAA